MERKINVISELKFLGRLSSVTRSILMGGILVLIVVGVIGGYVYGKSVFETQGNNITHNNALQSSNYQLKFKSLDSKEVTGMLSEGLKLTYKSEEFTSPDLEIIPSEKAKTLNLKIVLNNEILNLILPLFVEPETISSNNELQPASSSLQGESATVSKSTGKYVASKSGGKYHLLDCRYAKKMKDGNRTLYGSKGEAEADGKDPCGVCKP